MRKATGRSIPRSPENSTIWHNYCRLPTGWRRPNRFFAEHSASIGNTIGLEHPRFRRVLYNYSALLTAMGLSEDDSLSNAKSQEERPPNANSGRPVLLAPILPLRERAGHGNRHFIFHPEAPCRKGSVAKR